MRILEWLHKYITPRRIWCSMAYAGIFFVLLLLFRLSDDWRLVVQSSLVPVAIMIPLGAVLSWLTMTHAGSAFALLFQLSDVWRFIVLSSLVPAAIMIPLGAVLSWLDDRKYRDAETLLGARTLFTLYVSFLYHGKRHSGRLFASRDALILLGRDTQPHLMLRYERHMTEARLVSRLICASPDDERNFQRWLSHAQLILETSDVNKECCVMRPKSLPLFNYLRSSGWRCVP